MEGRASVNMEAKEIIKQLPYKPPFLFVDSLEEVSDDGTEGSYTFHKDLPFYEGHFTGHPVTPGVLLTECCAQIGLVCLGIHLMAAQDLKAKAIALSSSEMQFYLAVYPGEKVRVRSQIHYFRFNKLKCGVRMFNRKEQLVCRGILAGMLIPRENE
jgi:3-hydroxyacyl-[acyl-carrier-protein] dehydratase